ncbi:PepSY domain-containing protein [Paraburkholderia adhaesiva]|uniref:PepSY domain-containing protein n=1 Tax=Paraburkholderia adhaesiva TaxID=2883244 RepID=UPI001F41FC76|nr:PepSY domain-containing protein [Paraburkholderia adhaesiva]
MLRKLHSLPGIFAALLLMVVALSGAVLSVKPALDQAGAVRVTGPLDAATLAARVQTHNPGLDKIVRRASGEIIAHISSPDGNAALRIDPATGASIGPDTPSPVMRWVANLHRKLLLGDAGRVATGVAAGLMLLLCVSGVALLARRMGGWKHLFDRIRGTGLQRVHNEIARVALLALALSAGTGLLMSLTTFGWIPERVTAELPYPSTVATHAPLPVGQVAALQSLDVSTLRELTLPTPDSPGDTYAVITTQGTGYIDPSSGAWLAWQDNDAWQRFQGTVRMLHTGRGLWWLALILGLASASVPALAVTGIALWAKRRGAMPKIAGNASPREADTIILVGSENNATWAFAAAVHQALTRAGLLVNIASMNEVRSGYRRAERLIVLTSTYGDGDAPSNATQFTRAITHTRLDTATRFAVLGFGDRQFSSFCGYAQKVHEALRAKGLQPLLELGMLDRQSESAFTQWMEQLSTVLGVTLDAQYRPTLPRTISLEVIEREDYGIGTDRHACVLRLAPDPKLRSPWQKVFGQHLPSFEPGDLVGVVPPGHTVPRFYSLASASKDGLLEFCVRKHPHGVCSGYLTSLEPGDRVAVFVRRNEHFKPSTGATPLILIGAGTGIGPLVGFIRQNEACRPMHLYFGARSSGGTFLYDEELQHLVAADRLTALTTALSSPSEKTYVQERLLADSAKLRELVAKGAHVMVCGGRDMAKGVANAWERILAGSGVTVSEMKLRGNYVEDVY